MNAPTEALSLPPQEITDEDTSRKRRVRLLGLGALVLLAAVLYTKIGLYTIQPIGAILEGATWVVWREGDEPFFNSADATSLRQTRSVSLLTRAIALGNAPKDRIVMRLSYSEFAYLQSTDDKKFDR